MSKAFVKPWAMGNEIPCVFIGGHRHRKTESIVDPPEFLARIWREYEPFSGRFDTTPIVCVEQYAREWMVDHETNRIKFCVYRLVGHAK